MTNRRDYYRSVTGYGTDHLSGSTRAISNSFGAARVATDYERRKRPKGIMPPTNYAVEERSWSRAQGLYIVDVAGVGRVQESTGFHEDFGNPDSDLFELQAYCGCPTGYPGSVLNRAVQRLRLKIKDQSFNAAQAYAEREQTAGLIAGTFTRIAQSARDIRHGRFKKALSRLGVGRGANPRNMTDAILAFQYGVKPLVSDVYGAIDALDKRDRKDWYIHAKVKVTESYPMFWNRNNVDAYGRETFVATGKTIYGASASAVLCPANSALITASSLGLTNPVNLAWELLPFSFVADWALPIGDYLNSWDAMIGWEVLRYSQTKYTKVSADWVYGSGSTGGWIWWQNNCREFFRRVYVERTCFDTVPFAAFPKVKSPFSKQHALNAVALLGSAFKGVK